MPSWVVPALFWGSWAVVLYTYVAFPVLIAFLARLFGSSGNRGAGAGDVNQAGWPLPRVAMVVAAFNEEAVVETKLRNTWQIDYPAELFQLVIGSDGSSDCTAERLASCPDSRLRAAAFADRRGKISVLNDLVASVDADIIVMSDANTMFAADAVRRMVRHFADPRVGCVSGELHLESDGGASGEGLYWRYEGWIKRSESRLGMLIGCNGGIFALRRELYEPLPPSTIVEDLVLTLRVLERGHIVRFEPGACATEPPCATSRAEMVRKVRIGAGGFQALGLSRALLAPRYGMRAFAFWGHKVIRWCVPFFLCLAMLANIALLRSGWPYAVLGAAQATGILLALLAYRMPSGRTLPVWARPFSYFYLMNYALLRGFFRFALGTQKVTWEQAREAKNRLQPSLAVEKRIDAADRRPSDEAVAAVSAQQAATVPPDRRTGPS